MAETFTFLPKRTPGIVLHAILAIVILSGCGFLIWQAFQQTGGALLVVYLFGATLLFALLPLVGYRGYALLHGIYSLKRDGLRVRWGLRQEDIPLSEVTWVRPATDLEKPFSLPAGSLPGAILGTAEHPDLGRVEFIASDVNNLVVVATINKVFVLSPELHDEFVQRFQRALEMGTLNPMESFSAVPAAFLLEVARNAFARVAIPLGFALSLVLLMLVSLSIPAKLTVSLGYDALGVPLQPVPSMRMLLLPVLSIALYGVSLIAGIFFYRNEKTRSTSYLVWAGGLITPILLIAAAVILLYSTQP
jgi:hypothetical protein